MKALFILLLIMTQYLFAQINSLEEALDFFPLNIGDYWEYENKYDYGEKRDTWRSSVSVIGDTVVENKSYFLVKEDKFNGQFLTETRLIRIDSTTGNVYEYKKSEIKIDSLLADKYDLIRNYYMVMRIGNEFVFGDSVLTRFIEYTALDPSFGTSWYMVKGLGIVSKSSYYVREDGLVFINAQLIYARINKKEYGVKRDSVSNYYPLEVGNKWVYRGCGAIRLWVSGEYWWEAYCYDISREIVDIVSVNDTLYYKMEEKLSSRGSFSESIVYLERYDSIDCYVYLREIYEDFYGVGFSEKEYPNYNLCTEIGDTVSLVTKIPIVYVNDSLKFVHSADSISTQFGLTTKKRVFKTPDNYANYTLAKGFGLTKYTTDGTASNSDFYLKGCVIDGIVYGDTSLIVSVDDEKELPNELTLFQNYPNPFNPTTKIKFTIPSAVKHETSNVKLIVYDILGREIKTLINKAMQPGEYEVEFDASGLTSGIYFYRLSSGSFTQSKKMVLLR